MRAPLPASIALVAAILAAVPGVADAIDATDPAVVLATKLSAFARANAAQVEKVPAADRVVDATKAACKVSGEKPTDTELAACRAALGETWAKTALEWVETKDGKKGKSLLDLLDEQESAIRATKSHDGQALGRLNPAVNARSVAVNEAIVAKAKGLAADLVAPDKGNLDAWLATATVGKDLGAAAKTATEKADESVLAAFAPKPPSDSDILTELEKTREKLFAASEASFTRSVTCSWNKDGQPGKRLTCSPGLLLSGELVSDVYIEGIPTGGTAVVAAMLPEQRLVSAQDVVTKATVDRVKVLMTDTDAQAAAAERLDYDQKRISNAGPNPAVIEVYTHRTFSPKHGGGTSLGAGSAEYWGRVAARLRAKTEKGSLTLVSKGEASRLYVAVDVDGYEGIDVAPIPIGFARWKFESGGFIAVSSVVDEEVRKHVSPSDPTKVIVDDIADADNYGVETGVLLNFVPQNYQAIGASLGFATNESRAASMYLGFNFRVRTFGEQGLASLGVGYLLKSVTRFPGLEGRLGDDRSIAADSPLLTGKDQFEGGLAVMIHLGFSFGPIGGPKEESK